LREAKRAGLDHRARCDYRGLTLRTHRGPAIDAAPVTGGARPALGRRQRSHHIAARMKAVMTDDGIPREGCAEDAQRSSRDPPCGSEGPSSYEEFDSPPPAGGSSPLPPCVCLYRVVQQPHTFSPKTKSFSGHKEVSESIQIQQDYESGICKSRNRRNLMNLDLISVLNSALPCIEVCAAAYRSQRVNGRL
jgi:hypothetical protein